MGGGFVSEDKAEWAQMVRASPAAKIVARPAWRVRLVIGEARVKPPWAPKAFGAAPNEGKGSRISLGWG